MKWEELVQQFYMQGMIGLGKLSNPLTQKTAVDLRLAKISIETLELLEDKTRGNLSESERQILLDALHVLRVNYALEKERQAQRGTEQERSDQQPSQQSSSEQAEQ